MTEYLQSIPLLTIAISVASCIVGGYIIRWVLSTWISRIANRAGFAYTDIIITNINKAILWCSVLLALSITVTILPKHEWIQPYARPVLWSALIVALGVVLARIAQGVIERRAERKGSARVATTLIQKIVQITIYVVAGVMVLDTFDIKVTTIIATLGIGGLALALALQDTLSNAFAGIYITLSNQIHVGDFVSFETYEGIVTDIGWRTTVIRKGNESLLIVPNSKLSQAIITSFPIPGQIFRGRIQLPLDMEANLDQVEELLLRMIQEHGFDSTEESLATETPANKIRGLLTQPQSVVRVGEFKGGVIELALMFAVADYPSLSPARHELMKRIHSRFKQENIPLETSQMGIIESEKK
ncbi:MAG: mechanosensitive ion channel [Candidatus Kapabacteria bacterium]|nr:mechanosensitive ion channel [Candidatus Kapabacteria bacterium]